MLTGFLLALFGLAAAYWGFLSQIRREEIRCTWIVRRKRRLWLTWMALAFVLGYPLVAAVLIEAFGWQSDAERLFNAVGTILLSVLAAVGFWIMQDSTWTGERIAALRPRVDELLRTGHADAVVALIDRVLQQVRSEEDLDTHGIAPLLDRCFLDDDFARLLVRQQPKAGARLLKLNHRLMMDHSDKILEPALEMPPGILALELSRCQNFRQGGVGYQIPPKCTLLHALFDDAKVAERLYVWRPVGNSMLRVLAWRAVQPEPDPDVLEYGGSYNERDRWASPIGTGLWFFRVMVTEAMRQGVPWHMWLFYLPHIVEEMLPCIPESDDDEYEEFPTRYHYLLDDCLSSLRDFAVVVPQLPEGNIHREPVSPDTAPDNANIPKSSLSAYVQCLEKIVRDARLSAGFRKARVESAISFYGELLKNDETQTHAQAFAVILTEPSNARYRALVQQVVETYARYNGHRPGAKELLDIVNDRWNETDGGSK